MRAGLQPDQIYDHLVNVLNFCKLHRCRRSYCLCRIRGRNDDYRECAKGGFGPEAPLCNHRVQGLMRPLDSVECVECSDAAPLQMLKGRATRWNPDTGYYEIKLDPEQEVAIAGTDGKLYICHASNARPVGTVQCTKPNCREPDCMLAPPMGKLRRLEPDLVNSPSGVLTIELPRDHPRKVQGIHVVTEWFQSNDDQGVILCRTLLEHSLFLLKSCAAEN